MMIWHMGMGTGKSCFKNPVFPDEGLAHSSNIVHNVPQDLPSLLEDSALVLGNRAAEILTAMNIGAGFGVAVDEFEAVAGGGGLPGFLLSTC